MACNIIISGIGAIGGYYGGMLAAYAQNLQSVNVFFFMREGEHLESVKQYGLHLLSPSIDLYAHPTLATADSTLLPKADYLFLATKSYNALENLEQLAPILTPATIVIPMHNGLDVPPLIQEALPNNLILPAVCHITGRRSCGTISVRSDENLLKFGLDSTLTHSIDLIAIERAEWLYTLLKASGIKCRLYQEMAQSLREKYLMLSPSAVATTYFDAPIGKVQEEYDKEFRSLLQEIASLYRVAGWEKDSMLEEKAYNMVLKMPREATTSMHSDILAEHQSEIDSLVGYVVRKAEEYHIEVPTYKKMYQAILKRIGK
ncbi:hypothetical protein HQ36_07470 [Porphyromonas gingivicanis]|uniref:2-dehydropantoate 2-reductase n=1 Tax=Porphyromonas gingivicanis TaxID=266762 RepID=A0A0A2G4N4_9PORP|nr:2-dehydropantoate 2-reductase [Porphyromonas gingivicanis]KGN97387.1 hypothetical protein HQ36_07470 [Porphyromonas gingivicanis]